MKDITWRKYESKYLSSAILEPLPPSQVTLPQLSHVVCIKSLPPTNSISVTRITTKIAAQTWKGVILEKWKNLLVCFKVKHKLD